MWYLPSFSSKQKDREQKKKNCEIANISGTFLEKSIEKNQHNIKEYFKCKASASHLVKKFNTIQMSSVV